MAVVLDNGGFGIKIGYSTDEEPRSRIIDSYSLICTPFYDCGWAKRRFCLRNTVTGQLADKPTRGQSSRGLVNSPTSQLAEMFDLKLGVYDSSKCYFRQITLFICYQYSIGLELGLELGLMYK